MAIVNPLSWFSAKSDRNRGSQARSLRKRRRSLRFQTLETRQVLTAIVMTPHEQLLLELINRARHDPGAEAARYGIGLNDGISSTIVDTPKQPVAPNQILLDAAGAHSQDMIDNDYFSHTNLAGQSPSDRAMTAGYPVGVWENISYGGSTGPIDWEANVYERHRRLFLSTSGHRQNILIGSHQEVGSAVRFGQFTSGGWTYNVGMVTEKFGNPPGNSFLTGVAYTDASDGSAADNAFYNIGEQISGGTITATNVASGDSYSTTIGPSGGYSLQLAPGTYTVTATGGELPADYIVENVIVATENVKIDFETTTATEMPSEVPETPEPEPEPPTESFAQQFDFGTEASPLEAGYTRVTGSTTYTAERGYGWTTTVNQLDRGSGTALSRDLHYRDIGTFVIDVPNGSYNVTLIVGDHGPSAHDQTFYLEGARVDSITTAARQVITRTYTTTVNDGQLTLVLDGRGGIDANMVISGLQVFKVPDGQAIPSNLTPEYVDEFFADLGG